MSKITVSELKEMPDGYVIASGITKIEHPWKGKEGWEDVCDEDGMTEVKWGAVRGKGFYDWGIYHSLNDNLCPISVNNGFNNLHLDVSLERILAVGSKLTDVDKIKELVPCDSGALKLYRK